MAVPAGDACDFLADRQEDRRSSVIRLLAQQNQMTVAPLLSPKQPPRSAARELSGPQIVSSRCSRPATGFRKGPPRLLTLPHSWLNDMMITVAVIEDAAELACRSSLRSEVSRLHLGCDRSSALPPQLEHHRGKDYRATKKD